MIIGIILNNFKCYKGMHYIPLTNADGANYCGLIGLNGVGKSAILEALDCFFNNKELNHTIDDNDNGSPSYVIPLCSIDNNFLDDIVHPKHTEYESEYITYVKPFGDLFSKSIKKFIGDNLSDKISPENKNVWNDIKKHCQTLCINDKLLLPLFRVILKHYEKTIDIPHGIFDDVFEYGISWEMMLSIPNSKYSDIRECKQYIVNLYDRWILYYIKSRIYIYLPKNLVTENCNLFEIEPVQMLIAGKGFRDIRNSNLSKKINNYAFDIQCFLLPVLRVLDYDIEGQQRVFNAHEIFDIILQNIFKDYKLSKKIHNGIYVPSAQLSSGEKQQTLIDMIFAYTHSNYFIIAIDEPESSFQISERFEQFYKLYRASKSGSQVLFTSHWYGFIPTIPEGCVVNIVKNNDEFSYTPINIYKYKEEISKMPVDIFLKGSFDFIQTILSSVLIDDCYNWLICEGSSDKIYLEAYLNEEVFNIKLRIIPVGGCANAKKIYMHLALALLDIKVDEIKGKIFLLVDTDETSFDEYKKPELAKEIAKYDNKLRFKRLVNIKGKKETILSDFGSNKKHPTDMEGVLNGKAFNIALNKFKDELPFVTEDERPEIPSAFALDLRDSEKDALRDFFTPSKKVAFAHAYVEELRNASSWEEETTGGYKVPSWIEEIRKFFKK